MSLFLQQQLLVAGNTLCEVCWRLVWLVEWSHHDRIYVGDGSRHSLGLRTEQVHIRIEEGLVVLGSHSTNMHLASAVAFGLILLHNLCPQHTGSTELGNLHEVVVAHAHVELDAFGSLCGFHTSFSENVHVFSTPSQCITQLLIDVSTSIV